MIEYLWNYIKQPLRKLTKYKKFINKQKTYYATYSITTCKHNM